jgi:hypothetical protein
MLETLVKDGRWIELMKIALHINGVELYVLPPILKILKSFPHLVPLLQRWE